MPEFTTLTISGYSSSSIVPSDFQGLGLRHLSFLNSPTLTTLPSNALRYAVGLRFLLFSETGITSIDRDSLGGLGGSLRRVTFNNRTNGVELTSIHDDAFDHLPTLETLELQYTGLRTLDADIFDGLTALKRLELNGNILTTLDADIFDGLTALESLNLASNGLTTAE